MRILTSFQTGHASADEVSASLPASVADHGPTRSATARTTTGTERLNLNLYFRPFETEGWRVGPRRPQAAEAFTLLHLLGVLVVLTILLVALMPTQIRQIDKEARQREAQALGVLGTGLRNFILDSRRVPASSTVFSDISGKVGWSLSTTLTNARGNRRVFLVDPAFQLGTNTAATLPYVQTVYGATNVGGLRLMLVSSINSDLPSVISGSAGTNAARVFEMLWTSADNLTPFGWSWGGNFEDIVLQRLSLIPMFAQVNLENRSSDVGRFSVDSLNDPTNSVPLPGTYFSTLYFVRTMLGLHNSTGGLQAMQILQDVSITTNRPPYFLQPTFVFEDGGWRGRYYKGDAQRHKGEDLQAAYDLFMSGPANVYGLNTNTVNQWNVTMSMYLFMSNYCRWNDREFRWADKAAVQAAQAAMENQLSAYCNKKATTP